MSGGQPFQQSLGEFIVDPRMIDMTGGHHVGNHFGSRSVVRGQPRLRVCIDKTGGRRRKTDQGKNMPPGHERFCHAIDSLMQLSVGLLLYPHLPGRPQQAEQNIIALNNGLGTDESGGRTQKTRVLQAKSRRILDQYSLYGQDDSIFLCRTSRPKRELPLPLANGKFRRNSSADGIS